MPFQVRPSQVMLLGTSAAAAYWSVSKGLDTLEKLGVSVFGNASIVDRIDDFSSDHLFSPSKLSTLIFGEEGFQERSVTFRKGFRSAILSVVYGTISYGAVNAFLAPVTEDMVEARLNESEELLNLSSEFFSQAQSRLGEWRVKYCYNEALQWDALKHLTECLSESSINPPRFEYQKGELINPLEKDPTKNCSELMDVLGGVEFYKVTVLKHQLLGAEAEYQKLIRLFNRTLATSWNNFEILVSTEYVGDKEQLWLGRFIKLPHDWICNSQIFGIDRVNKICNKFLPILKNQTLMQQYYAENENFISTLRPDCSKAFSSNYTKRSLKVLSLPDDYASLVAKQKYRDIANYFEDHNELDPIEIELNSSIYEKRIKRPVIKKSTEAEKKDTHLYVQSALRAFSRNLNNKYQLLKRYEKEQPESLDHSIFKPIKEAIFSKDFNPYASMTV